MAHSLFEILNLVEQEPSLHAKIQAHLRQLLNTRQGSLSHMPDYGLPDLLTVFQGLPGSINRLLHVIAHTIGKYEPRFRTVRAELGTQQESESVLHVVISGQIETGEPLVFDSYFMRGGDAKVL